MSIRKFLIKSFTTLGALILAVVLVGPAQPVFASTDDFTFSSYAVDYYLSHAADGSGSLHVHEVLVAEFPSFNQNHGLTRSIPYTNQAGKNLTVQSKDALNLTVLRNGQPEPYTITTYSDDKAYFLRIGDADTYVQGTQTYTLDYDYTHVITEYTEYDSEYNPSTFQELYWDASGVSAAQPFGRFVARLHFANDLAIPTLDQVSCYLGRYGSNSQARCRVQALTDGYSFTAVADPSSSRYSTYALAPYEQVTFAIDFPAGAFTIPPKPDSYALVAIAVIEVIIITVISIILYRKLYLKVRDRYHWYKTAPVPPQYAPLMGYSAATLGRVYLGKTKDSHIATLLELTVKHKISLIKGAKHKLGKKHDWSFRIDNIDSTTSEQLALLKFLTGGKEPILGETYPITSHTYSKDLETAYANYDTAISDALNQSGDLTSTPHSAKHSISGAKSVIKFFFLISTLSFVIPLLFAYFAELIGDVFDFDLYNPVAPWLILFIIPAPIVALIVHIHLYNKFAPYKSYTQLGLEHSNYARGLELYIRMAETDRLKFLQSVTGADTSAAGIVKLYEELLPYAALFGLEQSWLNEMQHYCEFQDIDRPDWYDISLMHALSSNDFSSGLSRPIDPSSDSSGSSGGGGGGFSGGGGGGGSIGGW